MVLAPVVDQTLDSMVRLLDGDDVVVDGGNSNYRNNVCRSTRLAEHGLHYLDCGTSADVEPRSGSPPALSSPVSRSIPSPPSPRPSDTSSATSRAPVRTARAGP